MGRSGPVYIGLLVLFLIPVWAAYDVLPPKAGHGEMTVDIDEFAARAAAYAEQHRLADGTVQAVVGQPVPVAVMQFGYLPAAIRMRTGETYTLEFAAKDVMHGFSLQMGLGSINAVLMPGMMTMLEVSPLEPGEYLFLCNEYCGVGHHLMTGRIIVEGDPVRPVAAPSPARGQPSPEHGGGH